MTKMKRENVKNLRRTLSPFRESWESRILRSPLLAAKNSICANYIRQWFPEEAQIEFPTISCGKK
jgi:hypothetical protein